MEAGKHVVMVNVEADVLAGPALARRAARAGVVYSMAYGDQPALVCELVDWARASGFRVVAAGKGTKYLPEYHRVTPDGVWDHYGLSADEVNVHGGACAMGHPIGSSGSRIITTLIGALQKNDLKKGIATLCIGGGEATAIAIERAA